jgi:hypothetical protein
VLEAVERELDIGSGSLSLKPWRYVRAKAELKRLTAEDAVQADADEIGVDAASAQASAGREITAC